MAILTDVDAVKRTLLEHRAVAVLGAHPKEQKAAYYVPKYLEGEGYEIYPVNPVYAGQTLFGREVVSSLSDLDAPVDIVDVFRRAESLPEHVDDILAMDPPPRWSGFSSASATTRWRNGFPTQVST